MSAGDELLRLAHSSMKVSASTAEAIHDAAQVFDLAQRARWDAVSFTEAPFGSVVHRELRAAAGRAGYVWAGIRGGDCQLALHPKHDLLSTSYVNVLDAQLGMPAGNYGRRGIAEVTFETPGPGRNVVSHHVGHWLTAYKLDQRPGGETRRERRHELQTDVMIERVQLHGRGRALSFFAGDTNVDEQRDHGADPNAPHAKFTAAGLVTAWDAVKPGQQLPATHGGAHGPTIDVIGSSLRDPRVRPLSVRVMARQGRRSDHLIVEATYRLLAKVPK